VRIFVSSPSDVHPERVRAQQIIEVLARQFAEAFPVEPVLWEWQPVTAGEHFQATITPPSETDVVVVILWSRLGVPLPIERFKGKLSGGRVTGTEWEFEDALASYREHKTPEILVYLKRAPIEASFEDPDDPRIDALREEKRRLNRFINTWFWDEEKGEFRGSKTDFHDTSEFEELLERHLGEVLQRFARGRQPATRGDGGGATWHQGSPFRGLEPFDVEHSQVFFGRRRARNELREALAAQAAKGSAFVAVIGASGTGKSSLVRAGLLPDLGVAGMVQGVGATRHAILRPRDERGDPLAGLTAALLATSALPELAEDGYDRERLETLIRDAPAQLDVPVAGALRGVAAGAGLAADARALLVVVIDQFEEIFTLSVAPGVRDRLVTAISALVGSGAAWVVVTLRSDFLSSFQEVPELVRLAQGDGTFILSPATQEELGQIIVQPARAAGLEYEVDPATGARLDEELRRAAGEQPGTLPLLEYVLERLWHERTVEGQLTFQAYERLGGLEGALGRRAEEAFVALPRRVQSALPQVLRALVTARPGEPAAVTSRSVPLPTFEAGTAERALVDALLSPETRLLVVDGDAVRVAHEALLVHWKRAARQIDEDRRDLQTRAWLEQEAAQWSSSTHRQRSRRLLWPGIRMSEATDLLDRREDELSPDVRAFVEASVQAHKDQQAREIKEERRRRMEAEYRQQLAELSEQRAAAERGYSRAERNRALAARVEGQGSRPDRERYAAELRGRAQAFERQADELWKAAYALERSLARHPGAPAALPRPQPPRTAAFTLEVLSAPGHASGALIVHYGEAGDRRIVLVDGGPGATYRDGLRARLAQLGETRPPENPLPIELVVVTHYDEDRVGGIVRMFEELSELARAGRPPFARPKWLWFNNFLAMADGASSAERAPYWKEDIARLASGLGVRANEPFDHFVVPSELGPARVRLAGDLSVTVLAPEAGWLRRWYEHWKVANRERAGGDAIDLVQQTGMAPSGAGLEEAVEALGEGFSSPSIELLRAPPELIAIAPPERADRSAVNLASIVTLLDFARRRMLITGDARCDHIVTGLSQAGLLSSDAPLHVDLIQVPHWGSPRNVSADFFRAVTADHYVIVANPRYRLPRPETLEMIADARRGERYTTHIVEPGSKSLVVDLLAPL
jgi:glyoxylase-like metal-dependent hydrolase (beta-lactamase superfamily II)